MRIVVAATEREFAERAAGFVCDAVRERPAAVIALPSGQTPLGLYDELARRFEAASCDLTEVTVFAIDELYGVPARHPATNVSYLQEHLASRVPVGAIHILDSAAGDPDGECARLVRLIEDAGGLDLAVLGIGVNGHIAFNEPGSPFDSHARQVALTEASRLPYVPHFGALEATPVYGLTLGIADLLSARRALLLASGADKAAVVAAALAGPVTEELPASVLQRHPDLTVVLDTDAASLRRASR